MDFFSLNTQGARELQVVLTEIGCETETALEASNEIKHVDTVSDNLINQN